MTESNDTDKADTAELERLGEITPAGIDDVKKAMTPEECASFEASRESVIRARWRAEVTEGSRRLC